MSSAEQYALLEVIRNKGNCHYTTRKARQALYKLEPYLTKKDYLSLTIALSHVEIGEGADEFNDIIAKVKIHVIS